MTTDQLVSRLNTQIANLDAAILAEKLDGRYPQALITEHADLYNARNRLPLRKAA